MMHQTFTGWKWFDLNIPYAISLPMFWPCGVYSLLHCLHHRWNGIDLRDPERVQWTTEEYQMANPLMRWYISHQWGLDIFVLGGIGMIVKTLFHGWKFRTVMPQLKVQFWIDLAAMILVQVGLLAFFGYHGELMRYLLGWFILERTAGAILQVRDHLEHYGMWLQASSYQLTQLYAARNLKTYPWLGWLMGGLNYHAIHHTFADIPFDRLPEAFHRIQTILQLTFSR